MLTLKEDRSQFPPRRSDGAFEIDLESQKFIQIWQGPQHPGITGNMSLELIIQGDEVMKCTTHVGYLHRGFEKLMERRKYIQCFPLVCRICVPEPDFNEYCFAAAVEELDAGNGPSEQLPHVDRRRGGFLGNGRARPMDLLSARLYSRTV